MRNRSLRCRRLSVRPSRWINLIHTVEDVVKLLVRLGTPITVDLLSHMRRYHPAPHNSSILHHPMSKNSIRFVHEIRGGCPFR